MFASRVHDRAVDFLAPLAGSRPALGFAIGTAGWRSRPAACPWPGSNCHSWWSTVAVQPRRRQGGGPRVL